MGRRNSEKIVTETSENTGCGRGALTDEAKFRMLALRVAEIEIAKVWRDFEAAGLNPIMIKGWAAARYYPEPSARHLGDIDLAFAAEEYEAAEAARIRGGLYRTDLHRELRHLDTENWKNLFERSVLVDCAGAKIRVLCPEDHLRVLSVHWMNDGGAYRHRLWDIAHLLSQCGDRFDWDKCFAPVGPRRRRWVVTTVGLAARYLDVDLGFVPFAKEFEDIPDWVCRTVEREWASGVRLVPLHTILNDPRQIVAQIRKRIPPNALQSTIEVEGEIDDGPRFKYQLKNVFQRFNPSFARVWPAVRNLVRGGGR